MVPKRLKEARKAVGLSQERLSELIGIEGVNTNSRLSNYEVGRFAPSFDFITRVAKVLGYPEYYFYVIDDEDARRLLEWHKNRMDPIVNSCHDILIENQKLREQRDDALKILVKLENLLKR